MNTQILFIIGIGLITVIACILNYSVNIILNKISKIYLYKELNEIAELVIKYPFLENPEFIESWELSNTYNSDNNIRYYVFCTIVFNFLERLYKTCKGDKKKMHDVCLL